jgi:hypothetical protein
MLYSFQIGIEAPLIAFLKELLDNIAIAFPIDTYWYSKLGSTVKPEHTTTSELILTAFSDQHFALF